MMSIEQEALIGRVFEAYLTEHHAEDILQRVTDARDEDTQHHSVVINAMTLFEANMEIGDYFNAYPNYILDIFDKVLEKKTMELTQTHSPAHRAHNQLRMRKTFHTRITGLPMCPELTRHTIPRSRDVGHFLSVTGTVIRTSVTKVLEYERDYMCTKCKHVFKLQADLDQCYTFVPPAGCPNPDGCNSFKFSCLSGVSEPASCRDYQEIKIQEQVQRLSVGSIPRSLVVVLEDDLVDICKSGDDVTVYGVTCLRWKPFSDGARCDVELVLKANYIEVNNQQAGASLLVKDVQKEFEEFWEKHKSDPLTGRNQILLSLCPQVFGLYVIKLAVAMVLAGGVQRTDSSGTKIRGECHMLLVGDPGTGKSQFLKYAAKIISRSVLTAGIGSTSAGLTVAAVKDGGDWHLEAGALVLSDGGLCCIDEFNSIKEHDRISIHEAMEQQSISVAKAGMVCKLNTRTSILAATNPKGQYDSNEPLSVNVALASPLLSRFDLVLVLQDTRNAEWDRIISSFILEDREPPAECAALWSMEKMKAYFSLIKRLQPQLSEPAKWILTRYYQLQRQRDDRNAARTTIRMLESLSRLAEAHARLMFRETVTIEDAITAVSVMECSMQGGALLGNVNALLTSFPADPVQQYQTQCQILLEGLQLPELLQSELVRLHTLRNTPEALTCDPPAAHQCLISSTDPKTLTFDLICHSAATVKSGSDRAAPISPSPLADGFTVPTLTSTQEDTLLRTSGWCQQPGRQAEEDSDSVLHPSERVTSASEQGRHFYKNKQGKEMVPRSQEVQESERREKPSNSEPPRSDFQKTSKNLRDKRVQQPDHQPGRALSDPDLIQDHMSADEDERSEKEDLTRTKNKPAVRRKKTAAEAGSDADLHAKLSDFLFKPKKMRLSDLSPGPRVPPEDSARRNVQVQDGVCVGDVGGTGSETGSASTSEKPHKFFTFHKDKTRLKSPVSERKTCPGEQRGRTFTGGTLSPSVSHKMSTCSPGTFKPDQIRPVSASTVAKLSRFSFSSTTGPKTTPGTAAEPKTPPGTAAEPKTPPGTAAEPKTPPGTAAEPKTPPGTAAEPKTTPGTAAEPKTPPGTAAEPKTTPGTAAEPVMKVQLGGTFDCFRAKSKVQVRSDLSRTRTPLFCSGSMDDGSAAEHLELRNKLTDVNLRKRKCFQLGPPGGSLFGSTDLFHDVLDTDWDQEVLKTDKV